MSERLCGSGRRGGTGWESSDDPRGNTRGGTFNQANIDAEAHLHTTVQGRVGFGR